METLPSAEPDPGPRREPFPVVREVEAAAPFKWLWLGARAFHAQPVPCLVHGACFAAMGWLLAALLRPAPALMMALTCGFLLVGPFLAMGLYAVARRHEQGGPSRSGETSGAWRRNAGDIAILGIVLGVVMMLWARSSMMVIAIFFPRQMPSVSILLAEFASGANLDFVATYLAVGAVFALLVFAFTAVAIPLMLDRGTDAITAMLASAVAFGRNLPAMLAWAVLIVALTVIGFATFFMGLVLVVPLIGLATWYAYRDLIEDPPPG
jgi:uncharacterized membrane protein